VLVAFVALYILVFMLPGRLWFATAEGPVSGEMLRIRATGTCAFLLLSLVLSIGPLTRLDGRFLPLLTNRRHFGALTFLVALAHGWLNVYWSISRGNADDRICRHPRDAGGAEGAAFGEAFPTQPVACRHRREYRQLVVQISRRNPLRRPPASTMVRATTVES
jgi:hypothetical protein